MMRFWDKYKYGISLGIGIIILFLAVTLFINENYARTSMIINSFVLPTLFSFTLIYGLLQLKKKVNPLSFRKAFTFTYLNQFWAGIIFMGFILLFMNVLSPETRDIFIYQFYDNMYQNHLESMENVENVQIPGMTKEEALKIATEVGENMKEVRDNLSDNLFSLSNSRLWIFIFAMNMFFIINSIILSIFMKTPKANPIS